MLTYPAALSAFASTFAGLVAVLAARMSFGPGWRELRYFAAVSAFAALFLSGCTVMMVAEDAHTVVLASRFTLIVAPMHGAAWFAYAAEQERRRLSRLERAISFVGLSAGLTGLVPGALLREDIVVRRVSWLGWVYQDPLPTPLGMFAYSVYCGALAVLTYRYFVRWRRGEAYAAAHFFGLALLMLAGVNDSLGAAHVIGSPYLLSVGFLAAVGCVGVALTARFVALAQSLDAQTVELRATQSVLVQRERLAALGELSAIVAHEVRNPIAIMFNAISLLRRHPNDLRDRGTLLDIVDDEAQRLMRMVNDLLAFARPDALRLRRTPLHPILLGAAEAAHAIALEPLPRVRIQVSDGVPPLECDVDLVRQAVINLISNALQAAPAETVNVRAELEPEGAAAAPVVRILVEDRGEGVAAPSIPRLFTPFFTTRPAGTGLGLAIVRRVAEAHGGDVRLLPTEGPGATFMLRLPVDAPSAKRVQSQAGDA
jgi:signal transduction histidine kinase